MYLREPFQIDDRELQLDIIREDGWGHIIGVQNGVPFASHHPFVLLGDPGEEKLEFHLPKASPHWRTLHDNELKMVVFEGPKHYVSPKWLVSEHALPTWAFVAVHVYGRPKLVEDTAETRAGLDRLVDFNEARFGDPWSLDSVDDEHVARVMTRIIGYEMPIDRIEANFRLLQNRPAQDKRRAAETLSQLSDTGARKVAELIRKHSPEIEG